LQTFRDMGQTLRPKFQSALTWPGFFKDENGERETVWNLAKQALIAQQAPRGMLHTLLNYAVRTGRVTSIISTNIDSLEFMHNDLLPPKCRSWPLFTENSGSQTPWISADTQCFVQLHGRIDIAKCHLCKSELRINLSNIDNLINGDAPPCKKCSTGPRRRQAASAAAFWRPCFTFYDDSAEEKAHEALDEDYVPASGQATAKEKGKEPADASTSFGDRYMHAICADEESEWPGHIFVIGSSLGNDALFKAVRRLSKDAHVFVVNPDWNARFSQLKNVSLIKATAEQFADGVLSGLNDALESSD
jgi:NAD-dependent SIR2 family protein deacetylase